jgi:DNA polymerase I
MSKSLLIIDGMAYFYRAFYAVRNISRSDGLATNAIFGFIRMLNRSIREWQPSDLVVVFDGGLPKKRMELLPEYKANRPSMPDELRNQFAPLNEFLKVSNIHTIKVDMQEADDIIATIGKNYKSEYEEILVATGDKDMMQMIDDNIKMVTVSGNPVKIGVDEVKAKTGVYPDQIVDWLALVGDNADNIAGVPGVGPKTASKILNDIKTLEPLEESISKIENKKLCEKLTDSIDVIRRNIELVSLDCDVELDNIDLSDLKVHQPNFNELVKFYEEYEFHAFIKELKQPELFLF